MDDKLLAQQLRCPSGEEGLEVGKAMNEHNRDMNELAIRLMEPAAGNRILEIGPGNGAFVPLIFNLAPEIKYTGLDISKDMIRIAKTHNAELISQGKAEWHFGGTENIPFDNDVFDRILSVNTLYFLQPPETHINEIKRVLKPGGKFILCIGSKTYMQKMPFTAHGFQLYTRDETIQLLERCGLKVQHTEMEVSEVTGLTDEPISKESLCFVAEKAE